MFVNPLIVIAFGAHAAAKRWRAEPLAEAQMRSLLRVEMLRQLAERTRDEARARHRAELDQRWTWWRPKVGEAAWLPTMTGADVLIVNSRTKREVR